MKYRIFNQTLYHEDIGVYQTHGIKCSATGTMLSDVSTNKNFVEKIVKILNILQPNSIELTDTVSSLLFLEFL